MMEVRQLGEGDEAAGVLGTISQVLTDISEVDSPNYIDPPGGFPSQYPPHRARLNNTSFLEEALYSVESM